MLRLYRVTRISPRLDLRTNVRQIRARTIATEAAVTLPHIIQATMVGLQSITGAPWWATIAMSTVFVRLSLVPLVRAQTIASRKLGPATPEVRNLYSLLRRRLTNSDGQESSNPLKYVSAFTRGVSATMKLHEVPLRRIVAYPLTNVGIFVTFVYSVRNMINHTADSGLVEGGMLWFTNLSQSDPTYVLPMTALSLSYLALELGFGRLEKPAGTIGPLLKDLCQSMVILSVPFVVSLPAGVFCYWIPSSVFAIAQSQLLKSAYGQQLLRIPPMKAPGRPSRTGISLPLPQSTPRKL